MACHTESFGRFHPYLLILASSHFPPDCQRRLGASDIVQQTLLEAHASRDQYRGRSDAELAKWLRAILLNNIVDAVRAEGCAKRDIQLERPLERAVGDSFARAESWLAAEQSTPSQQAIREEELLEISRAVAALPPDQQSAIVLHHLQGWKLKQVAEHFNRSESAVAGLISRGMRSLRQRLRNHNSTS